MDKKNDHIAEGLIGGLFVGSLLNLVFVGMGPQYSVWGSVAMGICTSFGVVIGLLIKKKGNNADKENEET